MTGERKLNPDQEQAKEKWLSYLAEFIVEANKNTWAAEGAEVEPERKGYRELEYKRGEWRLRDSYTGYFRAPGMTTVYYKDMPVWTMAYGGHGQTEGHENGAKQTFQILKEALIRVTPSLPFRGPEKYQDGKNQYSFKMLKGNITNGLWEEEITEDEVTTFTQTGIVGIVIHKSKDRQPILPWNL
ncbi:hypothetical protein HY045_03975 [Candidatus Woesebacteria bacterium]|nr:hypothetical protein [Candidatus Woesebacteria bacterium]